MRYLIEMDLFLKGTHDLREFYGVPIIFGQVLFQEK
jgi:hypothetical protein